MTEGAMKPKKFNLAKLVQKLRKEVNALLNAGKTDMQHLKEITLMQTKLYMAEKRLKNVCSGIPEYGDEPVYLPDNLRIETYD